MKTVAKVETDLATLSNRVTYSNEQKVELSIVVGIIVADPNWKVTSILSRQFWHASLGLAKSFLMENKTRTPKGSPTIDEKYITYSLYSSLYSV